MVRNLANLSSRTYDLLVIGGGIYGVCIAWDAVLRGLSVALVEKGDFGGATSANSLRVIHGGLRYLQHGDIARMRQSIRERTTFMRIAPHLVHPLPVLLPTYGHGLRGKEVLSIASSLDKLIGFDRNRLADPQKHLPGGRLISKNECIRLFPCVEKENLTGGVMIHDCQMSGSERLVLSFARAAAERGAELANYTEVTALTTEKDRVKGVMARNVLTGDEFSIRAKVTVNASGPWLDQVVGLLRGQGAPRRLTLSKAFNLRVKRKIVPECAVGVYSRALYTDSDSFVRSGSRLYFIIPWNERSLIGTAHLPYDGGPDQFQVTETEIEAFLVDVNKGCAGIQLRREDVDCVYGGLLPMKGGGRAGIRLVKHPRLYEHRDDGVDGLISVAGVKFTEARRVAEKVVDRTFAHLGKAPPKCSTAITPVYGGEIARLNDFVFGEIERRPSALGAEGVRRMIDTYGSAYREVLPYLDGPCALPQEDSCRASAESRSSGSHLAAREEEEGFLPVLRALVLYAVRHEMAQKLSDVVFRRTWLGSGVRCSAAHLRECVAVMSRELGWDRDRARLEAEEVSAILQSRSGGEKCGWDYDGQKGFTAAR